MSAALRACLRLIGRLAAVTVIVVVVCFIMTERLPGDMAFQVAAARYDVERVTPTTREAVHAELDLGAPASQRFIQWMGAFVSGDLGRSVVTGQPVAEMLGAPLGRTLTLVAIAWPISVLLGAALGLWLSLTPGRLAVAKLVGALAAGTPTYVLGLALVLLVAIEWRLLPSAGYGGAAHLILPAATLALRGAARLALVCAVSVSSVMTHPSIAFARMKGLSETNVLVGHAFPFAAPPIVAFAFAGLAAHLGGVVIIEELFDYPGVGKLLVDAVVVRDVPVIQASATLAAAMVVVCNALCEASSRLFDRRAPRC